MGRLWRIVSPRRIEPCRWISWIRSEKMEEHLPEPRLAVGHETRDADISEVLGSRVPPPDVDATDARGLKQQIHQTDRWLDEGMKGERPSHQMLTADLLASFSGSMLSTMAKLDDATQTQTQPAASSQFNCRGCEIWPTRDGQDCADCAEPPRRTRSEYRGQICQNCSRQSCLDAFFGRLGKGDL